MPAVARHAAVIGGGIMGCDIAAMLAAGGWTVEVMSPTPNTREKLPGRLAASLKALGAPPERARDVAARATLAELPWSRIDFVVEAVTEALPVKQAVFAELGRLSRPDTVLATNTSALSIGEVGRDAAHPGRVVGLHFFMPAHLVPLVEVVSTERTERATAERLIGWMKELGKAPIDVARDVPGFVGNRLQHAMIREALWLIEDGVTDADGVDTAVRYGFGFRFIACGPVLQKEMSGWDTHAAAARTIYPHLHNESTPPPFVEEMVRSGRIGMKAGKGLWEWTPDEVAAEKAKIERRLQSGMAILKDQD